MKRLTTALLFCLPLTLLVGLVLGASAQQAEPADQDAKKENPPAGQPAGTVTPAPQPQDADVPTPAQPSSEDIIRQFQKQRPQAIPILPSGGEDETIIRGESATGGSVGGLLLPDGARMVDRSGRVLREGEWWIFSFEPDSTGVADLPMKLLPNRSLERMVRESRGGADSVIFIVSGEVTEFRGENFLLPRKVLRKRNFGNLKK